MRIFFETACIIHSKGRNVETGSLERIFTGIIAVGRNCEILPSLFQRACFSDCIVISILTSAFHYVTCYYTSRPGSCYLMLLYACHSKGRWPTVDIRTVAADLLNPFFSSKSWGDHVAIESPLSWFGYRKPPPLAPLCFERYMYFSQRNIFGFKTKHCAF
jgi:hypothetical protein